LALSPRQSDFVMSIYFKHKIPIKSTMVFEKIFEPELRSSLKEKEELLKNCDKSYLFINDKIAGEIYSEDTELMKITDNDAESFPDAYERKYLDNRTSYLYSCSILPGFQGNGYGRLLYAHHMGYLKAFYYSLITGHSTSPEMDNLNKFFKAKFFPKRIHKNWWGTARVAKFFEIKI
jgi:ribosomal protein S18 acetylase RimI-like enzyme